MPCHWSRYVCILLSLLTLPPAAQAYVPTSAYKPRQMEGFTVLVNPELETHAESATAAFQELAAQLKAINGVMPDKPLTALHKVKVWLEWDNRKDGAAEFHPSAQWLREHGYNPEKAGCVEISNAAHFVQWSHNEQPWMLLHEMAHAYRFLTLGDKFTGVQQAYAQAMRDKLYESVAYVHGTDKRKAYAATDAEEYFAELSEAYFGKNDFYPFTRAELERHDPVGYKLMVQVWGRPKENNDASKDTMERRFPRRHDTATSRPNA